MYIFILVFLNTLCIFNEHSFVDAQGCSFTSRRELRAFANAFVVVRILCAEVTSWRSETAYFSRRSTVPFDVYP
jgi:hypothetical protein